jgi:hypothetical protein
VEPAEPVIEPAFIAPKKPGIFRRFFRFINIFGHSFRLIKWVITKMKRALREAVSTALMVIPAPKPAAPPEAVVAPAPVQEVVTPAEPIILPPAEPVILPIVEPATAEEAMKQQKNSAIIGQGIYEIVEDTGAKPRRGLIAYLKEEILGITPRPVINKRKKKEQE